MRKSFSCSIVIAILFAGLTIVPISLGVTPISAQSPPISQDNNQQPQPPRPPHFPIPYGQQPPFGQASNFTFGPIASIQNDDSGQPAWLAVGNWRGNLLSFNETTTTADNSDGNTSSLESAVFTANFRMIMLDGSEEHTHVITNFRLSNVSSDNNGTMTYAGNSTISMEEAPLVDVPTTIKISGEIISIFPEPSSVDRHYGDTPIYGAVAKGPDNNRMGPPFSPPLTEQQQQQSSP